MRPQIDTDFSPNLFSHFAFCFSICKSMAPTRNIKFLKQNHTFSFYVLIIWISKFLKHNEFLNMARSNVHLHMHLAGATPCFQKITKKILSPSKVDSAFYFTGANPFFDPLLSSTRDSPKSPLTCFLKL